MTCRNKILQSSDQVNSVLEAFREELDDHREAINENTNEIQASHEYFEALNNKLDKLSARLDELTLLVKGKKEDKNFNFSPLTKREKEVFQTLLLLCEMAPCTTYREIARRLAMSDALVAQYITNMIEKGIPIVKKYYENKVFLKIDPDFRDLQLKQNVLKIDSLLTNWVR
ncbi:winged helix-turn-helix transcriptional regulator [Candidatus Woesearchaeota archaeon]|nr:winged helix-turn-helix transcriptional regulator [Candidatus Woesearchaeota archaeon]